MCRLFGYSKQSFYQRKSSKSNAKFTQDLLHKVLEIRKQLPRIGVRKIHYLINSKLPEEQKIGRDYLFSFMREQNLLVSKQRKYYKTTNSKHWMRKYPNIAKDIELTRPEQLWVADITYLQTHKKHYYLHLVTDAYSKKIVGYQLSDNMLAITTLKALKKAINGRLYKKELTHHSDRGLQYSSTIYTETLLKNNIKISMTEQSDPYENAIAERVNGILKDEFRLDQQFRNYTLLKQQLEQAVALYNQNRPHFSIQLLTPNQAHLQQKIKLKTWKNKHPSRLTLRDVKNNTIFTR